MVSVSIKTDFQGVQRKYQRLHADLRDKVMVASLNKTVEKGRTEMIRAITDEYTIKASDVRPRLAIIRSRAGHLTAELNPFASRKRGRSLNLIRFIERSVSLAEARRRVKRGDQSLLRVKIKRREGVKVLRQPPWAAGKPFILTNRRTGGTFVGARETKTRDSVRSVQTIDVAQMFNARRVSGRVVKRILREFPIEFDRATRFFLDRA